MLARAAAAMEEAEDSRQFAIQRHNPGLPPGILAFFPPLSASFDAADGRGRWQGGKWGIPAPLLRYTLHPLNAISTTRTS
jgi:hypothetical protein